MSPFSAYTTVYRKDSGAPERIYRTSLREFLETGDYTTTPPEGQAVPSPDAPSGNLPTAAREESRVEQLRERVAAGMVEAPAGMAAAMEDPMDEDGGVVEAKPEEPKPAAKPAAKAGPARRPAAS